MSKLADTLAEWVCGDDFRLLGEARLSHCKNSGLFHARHVGDEQSTGLVELRTPAEVREMTKFDSAGNYRPLKTAPGMKRGWVIRDADREKFFEKVDALYPAALAGTARYLEGQAHPVALRKTLDRQTGMHRFSKNITDSQANQIMRQTCSRGCLRKIAWPIDESCPCSRFGMDGARIPLVCLEACTFVVSEARRLAREAYDKSNAPSQSGSSESPNP